MDDRDPTVLVVGGRTTGLMMAAELARHGVSVRIVDRSPGIDPHVRANLIHSRTLEIFDTLGIVDAATEGSFEEHGFSIHANGTYVGSVDFAPVDSPHPFGRGHSQAHTEAVLEDHLATYGVEVERSVSLTALEQNEHRVVATLANQDGREERVEVPWLVGCDGAHSGVRRLIGSAFPGDTDPYPYVLADVTVRSELSDDKSHMFLHDDGDLFVFALLPERRRLVCANLPAHTEARTPTLEEMQSLVDRRAIPGIRLEDPRWLAHFQIQYRLVPHYRDGRVFLAGDAAHVHSLLGGHGMNTGIQDAHNLAWKLALVMRGVVPESWLDSYESERRAVGQGVIQDVRTMTDQSEVFAELSEDERRRVVQQFFIPETERQKAGDALQEVDIDYGASPLCLATERFERGPAVGARAPDAMVEVDGVRRRIFELFGSTRHQLFCFSGLNPGDSPTTSDAIGATADEAASNYGDWIEVSVVSTSHPPDASFNDVRVLLDADGSLHERYGATNASLFLIRPDGYVALRSEDPKALATYFEKTLR